MQQIKYFLALDVELKARCDARGIRTTVGLGGWPAAIQATN